MWGYLWFKKLGINLPKLKHQNHMLAHHLFMNGCVRGVA
jgi:hypothetical protein